MRRENKERGRGGNKEMRGKEPKKRKESGNQERG